MADETKSEPEQGVLAEVEAESVPVRSDVVWVLATDITKPASMAKVNHYWHLVKHMPNDRVVQGQHIHALPRAFAEQHDLRYFERWEGAAENIPDEDDPL